jgi:hypothetical protein
MSRAAGLLAAVAGCACLCPTVGALAAPTQVNVRIEGRSHTLFEGPILTEGHPVSSYKADGGSATEDVAEHSCDGIDPFDPQTTEAGPTPTAASVDAMDLIGETQAMAGQWYPDVDDYLVKQWGSESENAEADGRSWGGLVNNVFTKVGGCQQELAAGDEVLWAYNAFEHRPLLALFAVDAHYTEGERPLTAVATLDEPFEVEVLAYGDPHEGTPPAHPERTGGQPFAGASVAPVITSTNGFETLQLASPETVVTDSVGVAKITFSTPGWHRLKAGAPIESETDEEEAVRSNRLDVCVPPSGASSCGEAPPEDRVRIPSRYLSPPPGEEHTTETPPAGGSGSGGGSTGGGSPGPAQTGQTGTGQTLGITAQRPTPLAVERLSDRRLVLELSEAGVVHLKIAVRVRAGRRLMWRLTKTLSVKARRAGRLTVGLPRFRPGSYRLSVALGSGKALMRELVVR